MVLKQGDNKGSGKTVKRFLKKNSNLSRKQIIQLKRNKIQERQQKLDAVKRVQKAKRIMQIQKGQNKSIIKVFDRSTLTVVQEGLTEAIKALGEEVTPLSLFMASSMALRKLNEKRHAPYMLAIAYACIPKLKQAVVFHQAIPTLELVDQLIAESLSSNMLVATKAMKLAQRVLLTIDIPNETLIRQFERLLPNKAHTELTKLYLTTYRKILEQAATRYSCEPKVGSISSKRPFSLSRTQHFYLEALPRFISSCLSAQLLEAPVSIVKITYSELGVLFERTLSPRLVESAEGTKLINELISNQLLELFKSDHQKHWGYAVELLIPLFNRIHYLKRTDSKISFTERFPGIRLLLQVLNKLRVLEDASLSGKIEKAMIAIGKGMTVEEFTSILIFDPKASHEAELRALEGNLESTAERDPWAMSYLLNVIRKIASHDSIDFFTNYYFPSIRYCSAMAVQSENSGRHDEFIRWSALLLQYWRIGASFCHYPRVITEDSFRELAKQLTGLLGNSTFADTSATAIHALCSSYISLSNATGFSDDDEDDDDDVVDDDDDDDNNKNNNNDNNDSNHHSTNNVISGNSGGTSSTANFRKKNVAYTKTALDEDEYFLNMNDPDWNPNVYHGISKETAQHVCQDILSKYSANIMPKLCNTFEKHDTTALLMAIQSFAKVCKPDTMKTIIKGILDVGSNISAEVFSSRNAHEAAPEVTRAGNAPISSKRKMVLDIACCVIVELPSEHILEIFNNIIDPVLSDPSPDSRILQKKAYKLLFVMFEHRLKDLFPIFQRVFNLLSASRERVSISSLKMRVRCLSWSLDACKISAPEELPRIIHSLVGELVLLVREHASEVRALALEMLEKMDRYLAASGSPSNSLLHMAAAGISSKSPTMISGALVCMAKILYLTHENLPDQDIQSCVALGFNLLESVHQEVRSAAASFTRMILKLMKRSPKIFSAVEGSLQKLLVAIALVTSQSGVSSSSRAQMKVILEKCIKRFTFERIEPIFPVGSKNFLRYCHKMLKREDKRSEREIQRREETKQNEFDEFFSGMAMQAGDTDDLLQVSSLSQFVSTHTRPSLPFSSTRDDEDDEDRDELDHMHLEFQDGKLRIMSESEKKDEEERLRRQALAEKLLRSGRNITQAESLNDTTHHRSFKKRAREDEDEDFENDELALRYGNILAPGSVSKAVQKYQGDNAGDDKKKLVGLSANQIENMRNNKLVRRELKRQRVEQDIRKGEEFKGKGGGDVKRGNLEPFAYVPFNRRYINRRHKHEAIHRFEAVTSKSLKGSKAKAAFQASKKQ